MKICIDLTRLYDKLSGIERYALNISKNLVLNDEKNSYVLIFKKEIHKEFLFIQNKKNIKYEIIKSNSKLLLNQVLLPMYLYKNKCDIYLFFAFPAPILFCNKNIVNTVHDLTPLLYPETMSFKGRIYFKAAIKLAMHRSKCIITVSESSKNDINKIFKRNAYVIYNGVSEIYSKDNINKTYNDFVIEKYNLPKDYILSLGTLEPRKNIPLLIDSYTELRTKHKYPYKLVITGGKGWKYDQIFKKVKLNNIENDISFMGFIEDNDLPYIYYNAKCFVFPSLYEGFGLPPLEAMSLGVPVICSNIPSLLEVVGDNRLLFENNSKKSLEGKLMEFLNMKEDIKNQISDYEIKRAKKFSSEKSAIELLDLINKCTSW